MGSNLQRFRSLTRLVIDNYTQGLALTSQTTASISELVLVNCRHPESAISESIALTSLQWLHLEGQKPEWPQECYEPCQYDEYLDDSEERKSKLQRAATALLSLPQLCKISGECKLITEYLVQHLHGWKRSEISSNDLKVPHKTGDRTISVWVKP